MPGIVGNTKYITLMMRQRLLLTLTGALLATGPVHAGQSALESGQLDLWDPTPPQYGSSEATGPATQVFACSFDPTQSGPQNIDAVLACERPELYGRDGNGQTYCNAYATKVLNTIFPAEMAQLMQALPPNHPSVLADNFYDYLSTHWTSIPNNLTPEQRFAAAQRYADAGYLVVASEPGHIGFVQPSSVPIEQITRETLVLSQGGATAGRDIPLNQAWRASALESVVTFFYKQPGTPVSTAFTPPVPMASQPPQTVVEQTLPQQPNDAMDATDAPMHSSADTADTQPNRPAENTPQHKPDRATSDDLNP